MSARFPIAAGRLVLTALLAAFSTLCAPAQSSGNALPDSPDTGLTSGDRLAGSQAGGPPAQSTAPPSGSMAGKQTKRILGVIPNFRSVSVDEKLPPQTAKEKFLATTQDSFDYSAFVFVGALSGIGELENSDPEFQQGVAGYARYYWHTFVDQTDENYQVQFLLPALLHQDSRYYTLGRGGPVKRVAYSLSRILITRTDSGGETFNASEIVGAGGAAGVSDLYYPSQDRTWTKTGQRWVLNVGLDALTFTFQEFWPDLNNKFFHQKN